MSHNRARDPSKIFRSSKTTRAIDIDIIEQRIPFLGDVPATINYNCGGTPLVAREIKTYRHWKTGDGVLPERLSPASYVLMPSYLLTRHSHVQRSAAIILYTIHTYIRRTCTPARYLRTQLEHIRACAVHFNSGNNR